MKTKALAIFVALLAAVLVPSRAVAEAEVSFQFFYDNLSPHGEWIEVGDYGECWQPRGVDEDWSPYTDGYWSYTDAGWTWVSYEDFGGITYHYGRWVRADEVGWCWVPDTEWGPAWVSWRNSDDHVGWAPLPPEATFQASVGISTWVDDSYDIGPDYYNFVPVVEFGAPLIRTVCVPRFERVAIYSRCVNITNISYNSYSDVVFCGGPSFTFINERCHRPIPALKLVQNFNITNIHERGGRFNSWNQGNTLNVYAPKIVKNKSVVINKPRITKVVMKDRVNRGWDVVKDPEQKQRLRAKVKEESKGQTAANAPARPFKKEELKGVPTKADLKAPSPVAKAGRRDTDGDGIANRKDKDKDGDGVKDNQQPGKIAEDRGGKANRREDGDKMPGKVGVDPAGEPNAKDRDGDGIANRRDKDKDGDGVNDRSPGKAAADRRGEPGGAGGPETTPSRNGATNGKVRRDDDGDGIPNRADKDKDGDGQRDGGRGAANLRKNPAVAPDASPREDRGSDGSRRGQGGGGGFQQPGANGADRSDSEVGARRRGAADEQRGSRRDENDGQADAARRQAAMAERQQQLEKQQRQAERAQQSERQARQPERQAPPQQNLERQQRQAERAQQAERQERQAERQQIQRQPDFQRPRAQQAPPQFQRPPMQQQAPRQGGGGGGGGGGQGKGKRNLTPEEAAALKQQRGR